MIAQLQLHAEFTPYDWPAVSIELDFVQSASPSDSCFPTTAAISVTNEGGEPGSFVAIVRDPALRDLD